MTIVRCGVAVTEVERGHGDTEHVDRIEDVDVLDLHGKRPNQSLIARGAIRDLEELPQVLRHRTVRAEVQRVGFDSDPDHLPRTGPTLELPR
jgi:hypothetical protein